MGTTIWSPLASGLLTGKYNDGIPDDSRMALPGMAWLAARLEDPKAKAEIALVPSIKVIADEVGISLPRFAIAWCLKNPHVSTVILGASKVSQLTENLLAADDVDLLTPEVMAKVDAVLATLG
jgi:aryl-alcohol dehydrogenase-like predicted oxidoreductase